MTDKELAGVAMDAALLQIRGYGIGFHGWDAWRCPEFGTRCFVLNGARNGRITRDRIDFKVSLQAGDDWTDEQVVRALVAKVQLILP